jgi:DNA-binding CsgD family transcriptional regulator
VFVQKAGQDVSPALEMLAEQFELTPAELRVLVAIMNFGGVAQVAAALKLSPATVRTHLRHVFEKTGVQRQADLVKLITSYPASILTRTAGTDAIAPQ